MSKRKWMKDIFGSLQDVGVTKMRYFKMPIPTFRVKPHEELVTEHKKNSRRRFLKPQLLHTPYKFVKAMHHRRINSRMTAERIGRPQRAEV
ncbi:hypothetical protein [Poriferisphaera sp. WC338]|uniref:hypothetical protein n=1 Tax=Poriferisphaera sp. WC338 TaxID=3425129 RepID=UPI003D81B300